MPFSRVVYIEQSDFRMKDSKDFYGLAPGKSVLLRYVENCRNYIAAIHLTSCPIGIDNLFHACRYAFPIKCTEAILSDDMETVVEIRAEYDSSKKTKPKVFVVLALTVLCA